MLWEIRAWREGGDGERVVHVRARCKALRAVEDVSLDCGRGVHALGATGSVRRGMSSFSAPIEGVFQWEADTERPEIIITWSDMGEPSQQCVSLWVPPDHTHRPAALRRLLRARS